MSAVVIQFPAGAERIMRRIFAALPKPTPAEAYARTLDQQAGRPAAGMFGRVAK